MERIELSKLRLSDVNVRKIDRNAEVESLAQDIASRGLKQNLVVMPAMGNDGDEDRYEVIAGGRRLQALQLLDLQGLLPDDLRTVPCLVEGREHAIETSLSENLHRVVMNPADEFIAFQTIIDQQMETGLGHDDAVKYCASRFGTTEAHVRGRIRLAGLAGVILDALRSKTITLTQAIAYAAVSDQSLQAGVFEKQEKSNWKPHDPESIRSAFTDKTYAADAGKILFIGFDEYVARGGGVERDLFTLDAVERLSDTKLVDDMVKETFEKAKKKLVSKAGADDAILCENHYSLKVPKGFLPMYAPDADKLAELKADGRKIIIGLLIDFEGKLQQSDYWAVEELEADKSDDDNLKTGSNYIPMTDDERKAAQRERWIDLEAMRLSMPVTAGTPFEGRIFLPEPMTWIRTYEFDGMIRLEVDIAFDPEMLVSNREAATESVDALIEAKRLEEEAESSTTESDEEPETAQEAGDDVAGNDCEQDSEAA